MTTFTCNACHLEKETGQFYTSTKAKRGHHLICKECWDERTRKYRLCDKCNRGLGALNDDPLLLRKAAEYLEAINATLK